MRLRTVKVCYFAKYLIFVKILNGILKDDGNNMVAAFMVDIYRFTKKTDYFIFVLNQNTIGGFSKVRLVEYHNIAFQFPRSYIGVQSRFYHNT